MRSALFTLALLGAVVAALGALSLPVCCKSMSGAQLPGCTCLYDDVVLPNQTALSGVPRYYHWVMTNWSIINVPDSLRPTITVEALPCNGTVEIFVVGPTINSSPFPDPTSTTRSAWNSTLVSSPNSITFTLVAAQYFITVYQMEEDVSVFTTAVRINPAKTPVPGNNGTLAIISPTGNVPASASGLSLNVSFLTAQTNFGTESSYLYSVYSLESTDTCGSSNVTVGPDCILSTPCGLNYTGMKLDQGWTNYPPNTNQSVTVTGLIANTPYMFNVAVMDPTTNITRVYTAARGTPTYQRVAAAASNTTIITIAASAGGVFVILVVCIIYARTKLTTRMQHYRATKGAEDAAGGVGDGGSRAFGRVIRRVFVRLQRTLLRRFLR